jgi:hypothetical protein
MLQYFKRAEKAIEAYLHFTGAAASHCAVPELVEAAEATTVKTRAAGRIRVSDLQL